MCLQIQYRIYKFTYILPKWCISSNLDIRETWTIIFKISSVCTIEMRNPSFKLLKIKIKYKNLIWGKIHTFFTEAKMNNAEYFEKWYIFSLAWISVLFIYYAKFPSVAKFNYNYFVCIKWTTSYDRSELSITRIPSSNCTWNQKATTIFWKFMKAYYLAAFLTPIANKNTSVIFLFNSPSR
mgnify:CR=1 FL=1